MMQRRTWLIATAAAAPLSACTAAPVKTFATLGDARKAIAAAASGYKSTGAWTLAQVLNHAAQSIEYSLRGFPQMNSALYRGTVGAAAFAFFDARGAMSHSLTAAIPGAPALADELPQAVERVQKALSDFEAHGGALAPHFTFGELDKAQYTRAHLMHLANHWIEVTSA
jgi:hypothetical protein